MGGALRIGGLQISWLQGGEFELDGGTMFGVVPKVLWQKKYPADEDNYIRMLNSPLLVRTGKANVIIETGLGNKLTEKQRKIFRVREGWDLPGSLAALGLRREDITHVVLTHMDFDHAGGIAMLAEGGRAELTFPHARHFVQRPEWEDALAPNMRAAHTYWEANFRLIRESSLLEVLEGEAGITAGVRVEPTGGHTRGHQVVWMESDGQVAVHMADLLPTHVHFNPLWIMAYDNFPLEAIERKRELERRGIEKNAWFTFYHDPFVNACRFDAQGNVTDRFGGATGTAFDATDTSSGAE